MHVMSLGNKQLLLKDEIKQHELFAPKSKDKNAAWFNMLQLTDKIIALPSNSEKHQTP